MIKKEKYFNSNAPEKVLKNIKCFYYIISYSNFEIINSFKIAGSSQ